MNRLTPLPSLFVLLLTVWAQPGFAGRPFATEDAGVLERRRCEIESYYTNVQDKAASRDTSWWVQGGCGIGGKTQLAVGTGRGRSDGVAETTAAVVGKTELYAIAEGPTLTAAYSLGTSRSTESSWKQPWSAWRQTGTTAALVVTVPGTNQWHANVGWLRSRDAPRNATWWALAWERSLGDAFSVGAETYGTDREAAWIGIGARWNFSESLVFDTSLARQTDSLRARQWTLGLKLGW